MKAKTLSALFALASLLLLPSCSEKSDHSHGDHSDHNHSEHGHGEDGEHDEHAGHDHDDADHDHAKCGVTVGPNGGRMLASYEPNAEFLLRDDNSIQLSCYENGALVATKADSIRVLVDGELLEIMKQGEIYMSSPLELAESVQITVSVKQGGEKYNDEFTLEAGKCDECSNVNYACTCENHDH